VCTLIQLSATDSLVFSVHRKAQQSAILWTISKVVREPELVRLFGSAVKYMELRVSFSCVPAATSASCTVIRVIFISVKFKCVDR
jgi:hypothetical protein